MPLQAFFGHFFTAVGHRGLRKVAGCWRMKVSIRFEPGEWHSLLKSSLLIALLVGYTTTESELAVVGIHRLVHELFRAM